MDPLRDTIPDQRPPELEQTSDAQSADRFERVGALGEGGMGVVELAKDHAIGRTVAIKRLKPDVDPSGSQRFEREIRSLGRLEHPGVVSVHDVGHGADGRPFLIMKHLQGETLESVIRKLREGDRKYLARYTMPERLRICDAVLSTMEYAHARGVIHRDIKPGNIMVGPHGEVTIVDWGLAKGIGESLEDAPAAPIDEGLDPGITQGNMIGTPLYMSPEQASGKAQDAGVTSDVYSMGVVFYELLCLEHYLSGAREITEVLTAVNERPAKFAYWRQNPHQPRVPIELAYWLQTSLEKEPENRYPSAAEMRGRLAAVVDGKYGIVCPATLWRRTFRSLMNFANSRPALVTGLVVLFGFLVVYGLIALIRDL